ncbi:ParB/RepB/Spo0J family partition protein [Prosthecomicrobium hirschii]|uniref:ParB/RepB/Spo0J family partition protein n=1 Tax=Prosthecodimorpha hirschii TaxID=665126 RepID=UPI00221F2F93|nr:ParB/RepB/Spo0J family partition protein [Prosthecomicrobium hirschii]MCW1842120.1 ParB/RepB/Spo0J family partition protein [Prosthecomicrobium hirschii]
MAEEKRRLGRGLAALLGDIAEPDAAPVERSGSRRVPIEFVRPNPRNPRRSFAEAELADLAVSVREKGIVQPILVRPVKTQANAFEIIAGERRWRAAQKAGLHEVPVIVQDVTDKEALELAIIENVQRADLNAIEEAVGYEQLIAEFGYTQQDLGQVIGKSRSHVANTLRLLKLPESVKDHLREGRLTAGHARALVSAEDPAGLADRIVEKGLTVRDAEALAQSPKLPEAPEQKGLKPGKDADTLMLEKTLTDLLGVPVAIDHKDNGTGSLKIKYRSVEQLDEVCRRLKNG